MLMDEFFALTDAVPKRRVHFNEFMGEVHERIHVIRRRTRRRSDRAGRRA